MEKSCRKCAIKASPRPLFNFDKYPKTAIACKKFFRNKMFWKGIIKKPLKGWLYFFSNPFLFNRQSYRKQREPGTSDHSLFRLQSKSRKLPLLVMHYLIKFDNIIISGFLVTPKITSTNLCRPIHDIIRG